MKYYNNDEIWSIIMDYKWAGIAMRIAIAHSDFIQEDTSNEN